eukprot:SAG11_NODE_24224_length_376_cov_1.350181_1_plen_76_part_00
MYLELLRRTMPRSANVARWCATIAEYLARRQVQRRAFVARWEAEKTAMLIVDGVAPKTKRHCTPALARVASPFEI